MSVLIALGGRLRSGKDAYADRLVARHGFVKLGMSDPILEHMLAVDPWIKVRIREGIRLRIWPGFRLASRLVDRLGFVDAKSIRDFRAYMQRDGSEGGREFFGEDTWVNVMRERVAARLAAGQLVVITGIRIPNELAMVRELGGTALWVSRPSMEAAPGTHSTERSLEPAHFDEVIDNSGTLEGLHARADERACTAAMERSAS
ncbi:MULTISPECIES: hypothetical protein [Microbacterium]|uniref:Adenylate kinase n=1 Tax=Microbacterium hominis TaxID=162426 RepID=A0A2K9D6Y7_9MICO|nr:MULTISPECIES: hypothetical protein [Microbacterium]AUG29385.1 hypothetical protein CXR34_07885 [Microbacterium hominis]EPD84067.1 hypothetical protein HMPREF1529_02107 [Microbacterium sp. oral taxon 186 str. F0373]